MTLLFTYQVSNVLANADYQLTNQSANVVRTGQTFRTLTSNFFEDPIEAYIISNETYLTTLQVNYQATIIITDGESNNIGSISFFNFFQKLNTKTNKSIIFAITTATGLLSGYLNGSVVIDMSRPDTHTIYLFKR